MVDCPHNYYKVLLDRYSGVMSQVRVMNRNKVGLIFLSIAAGIAIFTALAHMSCIFLGESCYRSQLAPEAIIQSAVNGSLLAPLGTTFVSSLFLLCAIYALSAANIIIKLPLLRTAIYSISTLCILRGLATIPLWLAYPEMFSSFPIISGAIWFISGVLILLGFRFRQAVAT